eukprot:scaffold7759_cov119-Isochrysis_galbana.AAC.2
MSAATEAGWASCNLKMLSTTCTSEWGARGAREAGGSTGTQARPCHHPQASLRRPGTEAAAVHSQFARLDW